MNAIPARNGAILTKERLDPLFLEDVLDDGRIGVFTGVFEGVLDGRIGVFTGVFEGVLVLLDVVFPLVSCLGVFRRCCLVLPLI